MSEEHPVVGDSAGDPLLGTVLADRYRIERKLGEGGMGAVYLAKHVILEKIVALKILHDEYARRRELVERFLHEAKAASRIRHEHVIDITDFGETQTKNVFFAMEYLDGHDLATELDRGQLPWPRIKSIALQICAALQAAHEAGVIHRDLKPENIYLIERLGNPDYVKVLDFGVAKLTEIEEGKERRLTRTGMVFGTPEYMSPEQARGEKPDTRVDIYAIGCILFEMVTGDVPFRADNFMGVLTKHLFDPLPVIAGRSTRTDWPEGLQEVISQALAKDKNQRFSSMNELAVAIDTLDTTEGVAYSASTDRSRRYPKPEIRRAPTDSEREREKKEAARRAVARAKTTPAPMTDDDLTVRQPTVEPSAIVSDTADTFTRPRRRRSWLVLVSALALVAAAGAVIAWQLLTQPAPPAAASAAPGPSTPPTPAPTTAEPAASPTPAATAAAPTPEPVATPTPSPTAAPPVEPAVPVEPQKPAADTQKTVKPTAATPAPAPSTRGKHPPDRRHPASLGRPPVIGPAPGANVPAPTTTPELPGPEASPPPQKPAEQPTDLKDPFGGK